MDFWSRLIGGSSNSPSRASKANTATERLTTFKRTCNALQQLWRAGSSLTEDDPATGYARTYLERLNSTLSDESRAPAPHPCLQYSASSQFYIIVAKLALSALDADITNEAARFFNTLIDGETEGVLDSRIFARALIDLVKRYAGTRGAVGGERTEGNLIELLFGVANKIRADPELLFAWFYPERSNGHFKESSDDSAAFAGATRTDDFPLFYLLIEFVHDDGRTGDFARTGLLYIIETASKARHLEKWLIESDLATLMASGLGALYSRLSRRLPSLSQEVSIPPIIALSDDSQLLPHTEAMTADDFQSHLDAFLSYLLFWQDTLDHCWSAEVKDTLLDHFQVLFLQQLLYPSLLESSDIEGGSTASVITYLYRILDSIDHPDLIQRILQYLLASSKSKLGPQTLTQKPPRVSLSRRRSMNALAALTDGDDKPSPDLFNLVDLIAMSIKSRNAQTVAVTLKLVATILRKHHKYALSALFRAQNEETLMRRPIGALNAEMEQMFDLAMSVTGESSIDQTYEDILKDSLLQLETHSCLALGTQDLTSNGLLVEQGMLPAEDTLLKELLDLLSSFFTNSVMTNLALTEALAGLACCQKISVDGWLLTHPSNYSYTAAATQGATDIQTLLLSSEGAAYELPSLDPAKAPSLRTTLDSLVEQVKQWREDIPDFETSLASHKANLVADEAPEPRSLSEQRPRRSSEFSEPVPVSSPHPRHLSVDMQHKQVPQIASRSLSPRGRKPRATDKLNPAALHSASPSPGPQKLNVRTEFGSPLRETSAFPSALSQVSSRSGSVAPDTFRRRIAMPLRGPMTSLNYDSGSEMGGGAMQSAHATDPSSSGYNTPLTKDQQASAEQQQQQQSQRTAEVSLVHILTNTIILQDFILELAAVVQTRASLFDEVRFD